jgi:phage/plasmid primase-like uncharacterized protein
MAKPSFSDAKRAASDSWIPVLVASGIAPEILDGRHHACQGCGGKDRFRFDDKGGDGTFFCGGGGNTQAGDGFALLQHVHGWAPAEALQFVVDYFGLTGTKQSRTQRTAHRRQQILKALAVELDVLRLAVADRLAGKALSDTDADREQLAVDRVFAGLEWLNDR